MLNKHLSSIMMTLQVSFKTAEMPIWPIIQNTNLDVLALDDMGCIGWPYWFIAETLSQL